MEYLYISSLISQRLLDRIIKNTNKTPGFAVQKFSRLIVAGFFSNKASISILSTVPYGKYLKKGVYKHFDKEVEGGVEYNYLPLLNIPVVDYIYQFLYTFVKVLIWCLQDRKNRCIIGDVLNVTIGISSLLAAKIAGAKSVGVVTDMPSLMLRGGGKRTIKLKIADFITNYYISHYSLYIILTEQMNAVVNPRNKPHIVMEGLADMDFLLAQHQHVQKTSPRIVMYAGGLHERYGLKTLVDAFGKLPFDDVQLLIYGMGPFSEDLKRYAENDHRIIYGGTVSNKEIVQKEMEATLLVNPRPTHEEFTKFSFPSKNIEYMASGTPLLTTRLPGMPQEYYPYIYTIDKEDVDGYYFSLLDVLSKSSVELSTKGRSARQFITERKNNIYQTKRIIKFIEFN